MVLEAAKKLYMHPRCLDCLQQNKDVVLQHYSWLLDVAQHNWLPQAMRLAPENLERQDMVDVVMVVVMMAMGEGMELCHQVVVERN